MPRPESYCEQKACTTCRHVFKRFELVDRHQVDLEFWCTWIETLEEKWELVRSFGVCKKWEGKNPEGIVMVKTKAEAEAEEGKG